MRFMPAAPAKPAPPRRRQRKRRRRAGPGFESWRARAWCDSCRRRRQSRHRLEGGSASAAAARVPGSNPGGRVC